MQLCAVSTMEVLLKILISADGIPVTRADNGFSSVLLIMISAEKNPYYLKKLIFCGGVIVWFCGVEVFPAYFSLPNR